MSNHHHHHHHDHAHPVDGKNINNSFVFGIAFNLLFVVIEVIIGFRIHSLSLLSDAGHNLTDVAALALSLLAFRLVKVKPSDKYTYGFKKTTILVALLNAVVLLISIGAIGYEAIQSFTSPHPLPGMTIALVAAIGIFINAGSAFLFFKNQHHDLNIKGAYLHLLADALVSLGLVIGGIVLYYTGWFWLDGVLGLLISIVIIHSTWKLLMQSLRLTLDGVPFGMDVNEIKNTALKISGIKDIHHIHVWAMSTTENALTAHVVIYRKYKLDEIDEIKMELKKALAKLHINHITIETETEDSTCLDLHHTP